MSVAGGLAIEDLYLYVNFAIFITGTAWTQLRQICYAGKCQIRNPSCLDNGPDGATHHSTADIALARQFRTYNSTFWYTWSRAAIEEAWINGPVYIRVARGDTHFTQKNAILTLESRNNLRWRWWFSYYFWRVCCQTSPEGYFELKFHRCKLVNIRSIKPLDEEFIKYIASKVKCIITVENHSVCGGLAGAISEVLNQEKHRPVLRTVGIKDVFTESGNATQLKKKYGLSAEEIISKAKNVI